MSTELADGLRAIAGARGHTPAEADTLLAAAHELNLTRAILARILTDAGGTVCNATDGSRMLALGPGVRLTDAEAAYLEELDR